MIGTRPRLGTYFCMVAILPMQGRWKGHQPTTAPGHSGADIMKAGVEKEVGDTNLDYLHFPELGGGAKVA